MVYECTGTKCTDGGYIIREKALDFAKELNITDFKASDGWLDR